VVDTDKSPGYLLAQPEERALSALLNVIYTGECEFPQTSRIKTMKIKNSLKSLKTTAWFAARAATTSSTS
jgi:hypothetical protein